MRHHWRSESKMHANFSCFIFRPVLDCEIPTEMKKKKMNSQRHGTVLSHGGQMTAIPNTLFSFFSPPIRLVFVWFLILEKDILIWFSLSLDHQEMWFTTCEFTTKFLMCPVFWVQKFSQFGKWLILFIIIIIVLVIYAWILG